MQPRKVTLRGETRWEVRIDARLRKQEGGGTRGLFRKQAEAQGYANGLQIKLRNYSDKAHGLTDAQKIEAQEAFARLAEVPGASLTAAVDYYLAHLAQMNRSMSLLDLGNLLLNERQTLGGKGSRTNTLQEIAERWGRFVRAFPDRLASSITAVEVRQWLVGLTKPDGSPLSLDTRHGYRRVLNTVFSFALAPSRKLVASNPVAEVELPAPAGKRVYLLPTPQVRQLLEICEPEMAAYFALCAFAGLRPDHCKELAWEHIHLSRMQIEVPRGTDKTDPERIVPIQPVLVAWLSLTPPSRRVGTLFYSKKFFRRSTRAVLDPWKQDCLRHNYATYRINAGASFSDVAREMGNSESVIRDSYFRSVDPAEAHAYWETFPTAQGSLATLAYWDGPMAAKRLLTTGKRKRA